MSKQINFSIFDEILEVASILEKSGFNEDRIKLTKPHVKKLEKVIPVSGKGLLYFCALFKHSFCYNLSENKTHYQTINLHSFAEYLGIDVYYIFKDFQIFSELIDKGLIDRNNMYGDDLHYYITGDLIIPRNVFESLIKNEAIDYFVETEEDIQHKLFSRLSNLKEKSSQYYFSALLTFEAEHKEASFIKRCNKIIRKTEDRLIFYYLCMKLTFERYPTNNVKELLFDITDWTSFMHLFFDDNFSLKKDGIIEVLPSELKDDCEVKLSAYGLELFYGTRACFYMPKENHHSILLNCKNIKIKNLVYDSEIESQILMFENCMENSKYNALKNRLHDNNLPVGICALFYGTPGTGKPESVFQIARKTNRDVIHVDIAETKSCWFGESEKIIKKVFLEYKDECKKARMENRPIPILLFNEADAIISKRKYVNSSSSVSQTENAMQNIILENLETFDGIMIAMTNLAENFDKAFERRFLFKVKFNKGSTEVSSKIWRSKLEKLNEEQAHELADSYSFSGGEIDNISRKIIMNEIITGEQTRFEDIKAFCHQEKIEMSEKRRIGFC